VKINEVQPGKKQDLETNGDEVFHRYLPVLVRECSDYLAAVHSAKRLLYRGVSGNNLDAPAAFVSAPWKERRPTGMKLYQQKKVDWWFKKAGFTALRSNSVFVSSNDGNAESFGDLYCIVPKNGFSFTWSPVIEDLNYIADVSEPGQARLSVASVVMDPNFVQRFKYSNTDLVAAIKSGHEVAINGIYYAFSMDYYQELAQALLDGLTPKDLEI
jgi:hypothetical protein